MPDNTDILRAALQAAVEALFHDRIWVTGCHSENCAANPNGERGCDCGAYDAERKARAAIAALRALSIQPQQPDVTDTNVVTIPADKIDEVARRVADHMVAQGYNTPREQLEQAVRDVLAPKREGVAK